MPLVDARKTSLTGVQNSKKNRLAATRLVDDAPHRRWVKPPPPWKKARSAPGLYEENWLGLVSFWPAPTVRAVSFVDIDQRAYTIHRTECLSRPNPSLIRRKNPAKFENDCISRNGRRIKSTEPNVMILVSF